MIGAILGDMIGAPYEFDRGNKTKDFPLFSRNSEFTDDSVMTVAVAEALMDSIGKSDEEIRAALVTSMRKWGRRYPDAGYGEMFYRWLRVKNPEPYGSYGNGSAMRVSSAGWLFDTLEETRRVARLTAEVTHNHPEGIKGAEAAASAIYMARTGADKDEIRAYITSAFQYDLSRSCDEIRPGYRHIETCQKTVPEAITAFLEGTDFEDVIRTAVSLGGDCDTLTCIAGGIAEAFYGVPEAIAAEGRKRLPEDMQAVLQRFQEQYMLPRREKYHDEFLDDNELIEQAISRFYDQSDKERLTALLEVIRQRMHADGHLILPILTDKEKGANDSPRTLQTRDGKVWLAAFTSAAELEKGEKSRMCSHFIDSILKQCKEAGLAGVIINPWGQSFMLAEELIDMIFQADGGQEYAVPDCPITGELLEDGSFLKRAVGICARNRTRLNLVKLFRILRDSYVWIPCTAVMSEPDMKAFEKMFREAEQKGDLNSLIGRNFVSQGVTRMIPDILQNGDAFFFPVFTAAEEMGEYGERFSKVQKHFLEAVALARNNERPVSGIVINAFTDAFVIPEELLILVEHIKSSLEEDAK